MATRLHVDDAARAVVAALDRPPLPADLRTTRTHSQHLLVSSHKAMTLLGWQSEAPVTSVARSVRWHLDHPPADEPTDFSVDDEALARAV